MEGRNHSIITDDVHLECEKEGLEKEGELNYLYIKYLEEPFIIGNYEALSFGIQYKTSKFFFGPEVIFDSVFLLTSRCPGRNGNGMTYASGISLFKKFFDLCKHGALADTRRS